MIVKKIAKRIIKAHVVKSEKRKWHKVDLERLEGLDLPKLSSSEITILKNTWPCFEFKERDLLWARAYKKFFGFDPYYISVGYHSILIKKYLNPYMQVCSLENKALVDLYFPMIPFPQPLVRSINGVLYDKDMNCISFDEAVEILKAAREFVIKPALGSMQGHGVKKIDLGEVDGASSSWFKDLFAQVTNNFIAQEVIKQHPDIARLNPTSLNCCRITSIYIDGKYTFGAMLKIGKKNSIVDNWNSSYIVGITKEGVLNDVGWDDRIQSVECNDDGIKFGGMIYPSYETLKKSIENYHKQYFPQCGVIGWDVVVDVENNPIVIEANLVIPGITAEQLCSGPFFKEVHDEIISKIKR